MLETIIIIEVVMWTIYLHNELMTDKKNIYGDLRICIQMWNERRCCGVWQRLLC
jgi:hypothetical protein